MAETKKIHPRRPKVFAVLRYFGGLVETLEVYADKSKAQERLAEYQRDNSISMPSSIRAAELDGEVKPLPDGFCDKCGGYGSVMTADDDYEHWKCADCGHEWDTDLTTEKVTPPRCKCGGHPEMSVTLDGLTGRLWECADCQRLLFVSKATDVAAWLVADIPEAPIA